MYKIYCGGCCAQEMCSRNDSMFVTCVLVTGRAEDGSGVAQKDPSTGRYRINFWDVHTMGTSRWTALFVLLMTALVAAG
jgi:hypothetical protein